MSFVSSQGLLARVSASNQSVLPYCILLLLFLLFSSSTAVGGLLFEDIPVSDGGNGDNTIASGNTSRNLAVGADGTIFAVYRGPTGGIRVARSSDRGQSFEPSVQVASDNFEAEIAVSTTGIVYVAWVDGTGRARVSRSLDDGASFSAPVDAGPSTSTVHMATDANRVFVIDRPGNNILVSADNGQTFDLIELNASQVFSDIHVDEQTNDVIAVLDNPQVKYFISEDGGETFGNQILPDPGGSIFFSVAALSSGSNGRFIFVSGSGTAALRIDLADDTSDSLTFGNNESSQGRSLAADRCGNVVDGFVGGGDVRFRVSNDLGATFGAETTVATSNAANVFINKTNGDILYLYDQNGEVFLSVFDQELGGCYVPELSASSIVFSAQLVNQTSAPRQVDIINSGSTDVQIEGITSTSGEFVQSSDCVGTLAVGESCPISVEFTPSTVGTRTGDLLVDTNVFVDPRRVALTGEGVENAPVAEFSPVSIDFGQLPDGATSEPETVTLINVGTAELTINGFAVSSPFAIASNNCGATLAADASCALDVIFTPPNNNSFDGSLTLDSDASGAPPTVELSGRGGGSVVFSVGGSVSGLASGNEVVLQNNGGDDLTVASDGNFTFPTELPDGSNYDVTVAMQPMSPNQTCSVANGSGTISSANVSDVQVQCQSLGIILDTEALDFGEVPLREDRENTVSVTNNGEGAVTITAVTPPTAPFSIVGGSCIPTPVTLQPSQSCDLTVLLGTSDSGSFSGEILLETTASDEPLLIALQGAVRAIPVPTLSRSGYLALALLLLGFGLVAVRRFGSDP